VTRQLREAAKAVDIELLDHVVIGRPETDPWAADIFPSGRRGSSEPDGEVTSYFDCQPIKTRQFF
jgi:hypothetical protein